MSLGKNSTAMLLILSFISNYGIVSAEPGAPMVTAAAQLLPRANDPQLVGYISQNGACKYDPCASRFRPFILQMQDRRQSRCLYEDWLTPDFRSQSRPILRSDRNSEHFRELLPVLPYERLFMRLLHSLPGQHTTSRWRRHGRLLR
jgi:hypothetical protein